MSTGQEGHVTTSTLPACHGRGEYRDQCEAAEKAVVAEAQAAGLASGPPPKWVDLGEPARQKVIELPAIERFELRITDSARITADGKSGLATLFIRLPMDWKQPVSGQRRRIVLDALHLMAEAAARLAQMEITP
jgi:hypothetical protein